ncbi:MULTISPECIES: hypothetical protein [unclassified Granulicatella]|uniref:hypothetical protein n=1 Tax=unclassified Granulicatella TaxID=2630493 RepID=UPI0010744BF2|nr:MULTISPECIES: hypothetical protein [unclassified Granulicatella]MBF0779675.1 hypothetical protein [Granulicatella sp. 19428wC4_WM01]TFU96329.1 hypothetical protein E4T68_01080 [Granulicatella sp. WM01]
MKPTQLSTHHSLRKCLTLATHFILFCIAFGPMFTITMMTQIPLLIPILHVLLYYPAHILSKVILSDFTFSTPQKTIEHIILSGILGLLVLLDLLSILFTISLIVLPGTVLIAVYALVNIFSGHFLSAQGTLLIILLCPVYVLISTYIYRKIIDIKSSEKK